MEALAFRGYEVGNFPDGLPSSCLYLSWQRVGFSTLSEKMREAVQTSVTALLQLSGRAYARCPCGESIHMHQISAGLVAEIVRDGKHILIHYDSCRLEGDELA